MPRVATHPGEILAEEFLGPLGLSTRALARLIGVPPNRLTAIIKAERAVTADTAIRLGRYFGTTSRFWLDLQQARDLSTAEAERDYSAIVPRERGAA